MAEDGSVTITIILSYILIHITIHIDIPPLVLWPFLLRTVGHIERIFIIYYRYEYLFSITQNILVIILNFDKIVFLDNTCTILHKDKTILHIDMPYSILS